MAKKGSKEFRKNLNEFTNTITKAGSKAGKKGFRMAGVVGKFAENAVAVDKAAGKYVKDNPSKFGTDAKGKKFLKGDPSIKIPQGQDKGFFGHYSVPNANVVSNPQTTMSQKRDTFIKPAANVVGPVPKNQVVWSRSGI